MPADPIGVAYGYVRASTRKQEESGLGMEAQIAKITLYMKGIEHRFGGMYVDSAVSGTIAMTERPKGRELNTVIRRGDVIVVSRLDRAFRRTRDALAMVDRWNDLGVQFHVIDFGGSAFNMNSNMGKFMLTVLVAFAELEAAYVKERMAVAHEAWKARTGGTASFSTPTMGNKWKRLNSGKKIQVPDEEQLDLMRQFYEWNVSMNLSVQHIAQHMNRVLKVPCPTAKGGNSKKKEWSYQTVRNYVQAEMQRRITEASGDPIATAELLSETEAYNTLLDGEEVSDGGIIIPKHR